MKLPQEIQLTFADLISGGVPERFPRLKLVSAENDISWMPHFMMYPFGLRWRGHLGRVARVPPPSNHSFCLQLDKFTLSETQEFTVDFLIMLTQ